MNNLEHLWHIAPLTAAECEAAAAIEATATEGWTAPQLADTLAAPAGRLFALHDGAGGLCGVAVFQLAADEASLDSITLLPACRGKGGGRALLTHALAALKAEGAAFGFLEVRAGNAPAIGLYQALGFAVAGRRKGFYQDPPEDALVMNCAL